MSGVLYSIRGLSSECSMTSLDRISLLRGDDKVQRVEGQAGTSVQTRQDTQCTWEKMTGGESQISIASQSP